MNFAESTLYVRRAFIEVAGKGIISDRFVVVGRINGVNWGDERRFS